MKKRAVFLSFFAVFLVMLSACSADRAGKKTFISTLFSEFTTDVEYLITYGENTIAGDIRVTKDENALRLDLLSPDPFTGMSVESKGAGDAYMLSIGYSGISAELPGAALDKISLLMTLFSDDTAADLEALSQKSFVMCEEAYAVEGLGSVTPYMVECTVGDIRYMYIYDSLTGTPIRMIAGMGENTVELKIKKFKRAE